jgi:hypothetical protein
LTLYILGLPQPSPEAILAAVKAHLPPGYEVEVVSVRP